MQIPLNVKLPEGWTSEYSQGVFMFTNSPTNGAVTVNFDRRWWNLGWGYSITSRRIPGCASEGIKYCGRGWQQKLVDDAMAALLAAVQQ